MPPTPDAAALAARIAALPLAVDRGWTTGGAVALADYPDGLRPTTEVTLAGGGHAGRGEHVAFMETEQTAFRTGLADLLPRRRTTVGAWSGELAARRVPPYARGALEAAAIDLALRQAETSLFRLAGTAPRPIRYVVSRDARADPVATAARPAGGHELKLDVASGWDDGVWRKLARTAPIAILDWKGGGAGADFVRAHAALPDALHEDPRAIEFPAALATRLACDASVQRATDVTTMRPPPAAVNLKPARVGGILEALAVIDACAARSVAVYFGGMWEVGVGRAQLHVLASLFAPDGPNDVAPLGRSAPAGERLVVDAAALGAA